MKIRFSSVTKRPYIKINNTRHYGFRIDLLLYNAEMCITYKSLGNKTRFYDIPSACQSDSVPKLF